MSKKLALEKRFRQCGTVDCHKRTICTFAVSMNSSSDEFFSGTALATNQNRRIDAGYFADELVNLADLSALADHIVLDIDFFLKAPILTFQPLNVSSMLERDGSHRSNCRQQS